MSEIDDDPSGYNPTPSHCLLAFVNGNPQGYVCPACGYLTKEEHELLGLICPKCLQKWLIDKHVQQLHPVVEMKEEYKTALIPTKKNKPRNEMTTVRIKNTNSVYKETFESSESSDFFPHDRK